jgi:hypothetical protein
MLLTLLALACTSPKSADDTSTDDTSGGDDTGSVAGACTATMNPTILDVIDVDWTATADATSYVEFGLTDAYGQRTPSVTGATVHLNLVGLPGDSDVYWHAVSTSTAGTTECSGVAQTGTIPSDIPRIDVSVSALPDGADPYLIGAFFGAAGQSVQLAAYDRTGEVVWYYVGDRGQSTLDMHYALDGSGILFNQFNGMMGGADGQIRRITMGGELLDTWDAPYAHHMFTELPDGTLTFQQLDVRSYTDPDTGESGDWVGDALAEIPPGGDATTVFSVWDWITPSWNEHMNAFSIYGGLDWSHGNMVKYDVDQDRYMLSLAHAADVLHVDRATGEMLDLYGLDGIVADPVFDYQHDPTWLDDTHLLMFMTDSDGSGAIEYELRDGVPHETWRHGFESASVALGQAERLNTGDTFINYGAGARLQEVDADGDIVWDARPAQGGRNAAIFGTFAVVADLYTGARSE